MAGGGEEKDRRKIRILPQLLGVPSLLRSTGDTRLTRPVEFCFSKANFPLRNFLPSLSVSPLDSDHPLLILVSLIALRWEGSALGVTYSICWPTCSLLSSGAAQVLSALFGLFRDCYASTLWKNLSEASATQRSHL